MCPPREKRGTNTHTHTTVSPPVVLKQRNKVEGGSGSDFSTPLWHGICEFKAVTNGTKMCWEIRACVMYGNNSIRRSADRLANETRRKSGGKCTQFCFFRRSLHNCTRYRKQTSLSTDNFFSAIASKTAALNSKETQDIPVQVSLILQERQFSRFLRALPKKVTPDSSSS